MPRDYAVKVKIAVRLSPAANDSHFFLQHGNTCFFCQLFVAAALHCDYG